MNGTRVVKIHEACWLASANQLLHNAAHCGVAFIYTAGKMRNAEGAYTIPFKEPSAIAFPRVTAAE